MVKRIFRIKPDTDFWELRPTEIVFWRQYNLFRAERLSEKWVAPSMFVSDPVRTKRGDFHGFTSGGFIIGMSVLQSALGDILSRAGELLPASLDRTGEQVFVFNCTAVYNCLDRSKTQMRTTPDGEVAIEIKRYAFHADHVGASSVFKIPETHRVEVYVLSGREEPDDEFIAQYRAHRFIGLNIEEVWREATFPSA
jgi:hypothetical protein